MSTKGFLKNKYKNYGAKPDAAAWSSISSAIAPKKKNKGLIWWFVGGTGVAAVIAISLLVVNSIAKKDNQIAILENSKEKIDSVKVHTESSKNKTYTNSELGEHAADKSYEESIEKEVNDEIAELPSESNSNKKHNNITALNNSQKPNSEESKLPIKIDNNRKTLPTPKEELITYKNVSKINFIIARETPLLASIKKDLVFNHMMVQNEKSLNFQWGGKIGSDYGANTLYINPSTGNESAIVADTNNNLVNTESPSFDQFSSEEILYKKLNRPVSVSFVLRFLPTSKLFVEIDPTLIFVRAEKISSLLGTNAVNSSLSNKTTFMNLNSSLNIGYKFLNENRWSVDIAGGITFERVLSNFLPLGEEPINLLGNSLQLGLNYHLSENISIRVSPELSWFYGKSDRVLVQHWQKQRSLGLSISLLKDLNLFR